ncbi:MAG: hypothetical protein JXQ83_06605 [Candidatus Glassbacteria bacterium]|nr:hypothetical protein [Candidatus Glassbacteria bacterium]
MKRNKLRSRRMIRLPGKFFIERWDVENTSRREAGYGLILPVAAAVLFSLWAGCSANREKEVDPAGNPAATVARGAKTVAVKTARAGALVSKLIATNTYRGGKRAVTWTGERTADGTTATLERLGLREGPVPLVVLERLPDHLLESLSSLEFVSPAGATDKVVLSSPDSRWEGEIFHRLDWERSIEVEMTGPEELIVVSLACFSPRETRRNEAGSTTYTIYVREDQEPLGEISFQAVASDILYLYGYQGWSAGWPGVFVVQVLEGRHTYRFSFDRESQTNDPMLICFFVPRYN